MNVGQPGEGGVQLHDRGSDLPALEPLAVLGRHRVGLEHVQVALRVGVRDHDRSAKPVPALQLDTLARDDPRDRDPGRERRSRLAGRLSDRERDPAHPAHDVAPFRCSSLDLALGVHQVHRRSPRIARSRVGADHALAEQRVPEPLVVDVAVDRVRDRLLEHDRDQLLVAEQLLDLRPGRGGALPGVAEGAFAKQAPGAVEGLLVGKGAADVLLREPVLAHVDDGSLVVGELRERGAVGERAPRVRVREQDLVPVSAQVELTHHELVEHPDHVRARAHQVVGLRERLLQRARAAEVVSTLQHQHRLPGPRQVRRRGEAVVASADDDRIPVARRELGDRRGQPDLSERRIYVDRAHWATVSRYRLGRRAETMSTQERLPGAHHRTDPFALDEAADEQDLGWIPFLDGAIQAPAGSGNGDVEAGRGRHRGRADVLLVQLHRRTGGEGEAVARTHQDRHHGFGEVGDAPREGAGGPGPRARDRRSPCNTRRWSTVAVR